MSWRLFHALCKVVTSMSSRIAKRLFVHGSARLPSPTSCVMLLRSSFGCQCVLILSSTSSISRPFAIRPIHRLVFSHVKIPSYPRVLVVVSNLILAPMPLTLWPSTQMSRFPWMAPALYPFSCLTRLPFLLGLTLSQIPPPCGPTSFLMLMFFTLSTLFPRFSAPFGGQLSRISPVVFPIFTLGNIGGLVLQLTSLILFS